jgi:hypothetical protein
MVTLCVSKALMSPILMLLLIAIGMFKIPGANSQTDTNLKRFGANC